MKNVLSYLRIKWNSVKERAGIEHSHTFPIAQLYINCSNDNTVDIDNG